MHYNLVMNQDLKLDIANNMLKYGGIFVKNLAQCILTADPHNLRRLEFDFAEYIEKYHPSQWKNDSHRAVDMVSVKIERALDARVYEIEQVLANEFLDKEYQSKPEISSEGRQQLKMLLSKELF